MTLSATIPQGIRDELVARLERITIDNGFTFDVVAVEIPARLGKLSYRPRTFGVIPGELLRLEDLDLPGNPAALAYRFAIDVYAFGLHADTSTDPAHQDAERMLAVATTAITNPPVAPHRWYTFGERASDAELGDVEPIPSAQGHVSAARLSLSVVFRVAENNPLTSRA